MDFFGINWDGFATFLADLLTLACYGWFSFLLGLDVWRAFKKRATWLPGKAFALSGVTVQIIVWWTSVNRVINECKKDLDPEDLIELHQIVISGRVAVCVFIGYLLPGMAAPDLRAFVALAITICAQICSELIIFFKNPDSEYSTTWAKFANIILLICIMVLGLVLGCTILASKTIHGLLRDRISTFLSITKEDEFQFSNERRMSISWNYFEDEVLKSWFVARACRADYVISRSVISSTVGIVVTICVIISALSNTVNNIVFWDVPLIPIFSPLFTFIIIGWVVICWRWLAAQLYYRPRRHSWRRCLCVEDFWTRNIVKLIHMCDIKGGRQRFQRDERSNAKMPTKIFTKVRLPSHKWLYLVLMHKWLYLVLMLQVTVVFFCKLCGLLSEVILGRFVYWCRKHMMKRDPVASSEKYARILKHICMPGEDSSDLWEANNMSLSKVKCLMEKGRKKVRSSEEINSLFHKYSVQLAEDEAHLLNMLKKGAIPSVVRHFPSIEKQYVKMTVVSLITIFIRLHKAKSNRLWEVVKSCREVWDLLSFADECDIDLQASEISLLDDLNRDNYQVCNAADEEFYKIQIEYENLPPECEDCVMNAEEARSFLKDLQERCEDLLKRRNLLEGCNEEVAADLNDSKDWMEIAPSYTLYKLCILMFDEDIKDFVAWTEESLTKFIACCVLRLPDMLLKQCWKWAQEFEEDKLWEAIHLAGKCKGMMETWNDGNMGPQTDNE